MKKLFTERLKVMLARQLAGIIGLAIGGFFLILIARMHWELIMYLFNIDA